MDLKIIWHTFLNFVASVMFMRSYYQWRPLCLELNVIDDEFRDLYTFATTPMWAVIQG